MDNERKDLFERLSPEARQLAPVGYRFRSEALQLWTGKESRAAPDAQGGRWTTSVKTCLNACLRKRGSSRPWATALDLKPCNYGLEKKVAQLLMRKAADGQRA